MVDGDWVADVARRNGMVAEPCSTCRGVGYVRTTTSVTPLGQDEVTGTFSSDGECPTCRATGRLWGVRGQADLWQDRDLLSGRWRMGRRDVLCSTS
jgi:hypothetical protein